MLTTMPTLAATLRAALARAPTGLPPAALRRVLSVAGRFPAALSDWLYLECRLGADEERVDLIVGVDPAGRAVLLRWLADGAPRGPAWERVHALAAAWADPASPLHDAVERIWLEFDLHLDAIDAGAFDPCSDASLDEDENRNLDRDEDRNPDRNGERDPDRDGDRDDAGEVRGDRDGDFDRLIAGEIARMTAGEVRRDREGDFDPAIAGEADRGAGLGLDSDWDAGGARGGGAGGMPEPGVFVDFSADALARMAGARRVGAAALAAGILGGGLSPERARALSRAYHALPPGASIPYVGVLLPRGDEGFRLCARGLPREEVAPFLHAAGSQAAEAAEGWVEALAPARPRARGAPSLVHLDVGAKHAPPVGLEYTFAGSAQVRGGDPELEALLDALEARGLCHPARRAAVARWPGWSWERLPHQLWRSVAARRINHVKVVAHPDGAAHAKAYLSLRVAFLPRGRGAGRP